MNRRLKNEHSLSSKKAKLGLAHLMLISKLAKKSHHKARMMLKKQLVHTSTTVSGIGWANLRPPNILNSKQTPVIRNLKLAT